MDRKKTVLIILLAALGVSLIYRYRHPFEQPRVSRLKYAPGMARGDTRQKGIKAKAAPNWATGYVKIANMDMFLHPSRHSGAVIRDPFFEKEPVQRKTANTPPPTTANRPKAATQVEDPVQRAMRELSRFRVFGSFKSEGETVLFIERGRDILVVRKGDWIDGKFQLKEITPRSITIWASEIGQDINIALDE